MRDDLAMLLSERFAAARRSAAPMALPRPRGPRPFPVDAISLVGREQAIEEVAVLAVRPDVRLVTLTGLGGIGKTRLAVAVGERLVDRFEAGTAFVPLAAITQPELVLAGVARAVGLSRRGRVRRWRPWSSTSATAGGCSSSTTSSRWSTPGVTSTRCWPAVVAWWSWRPVARCWGCGGSVCTRRLRTAHEMFTEMEIEAFAQRAARELSATGEQPRSGADQVSSLLTGQERQITQLADKGLSNPEIGARLFMSPRTVEWHLHRIFAKLNVTSRKQLRSLIR